MTSSVLVTGGAGYIGSHVARQLTEAGHHVTVLDDLADAHVKALDYLRDGGESTTLNCGYGHGYSVHQVLDAVERVNGEKLDIREEARRPGDPPTLIAKADRIRRVLGWSPRHFELETIVKTSLNWEQHRHY